MDTDIEAQSTWQSIAGFGRTVHALQLSAACILYGYACTHNNNAVNNVDMYMQFIPYRSAHVLRTQYICDRTKYGVDILSCRDVSSTFPSHLA